jgi:hypothetical protein
VESIQKYSGSYGWNISTRGKLEDTISEKTQELSQALAMINNMSNEMITPDRGCDQGQYTGKHISRIGLYACKVAGSFDAF